MNIEAMKIVRENLKTGSILSFAEVMIIQQAIDAAMLQGAEPVTTAYKLPEGWVAVPVEPTEEMIAAAMCSNDVLFDKEDDTLFRVQHGEIWRAMLSTAPQQEVK